MSVVSEKKLICYHCGEECPGNSISSDTLIFCCEGCRTVYEVLNRSGLCEYYHLNEKPGSNQRVKVRENKFDFLNENDIQSHLISYQDATQVHVNFSLPQVHCSSCIWLLENLHTINSGIISSRVNFPKKEIFIIYSPEEISLKTVATLLTSVGYEPYISLKDLGEKVPLVKKGLLLQLGVAGFCFANIMMLSFPEYLGLRNNEANLRFVFRMLSLLLSLPVLLYSALPFYKSAWKGITHKFLNIDAPVSFAILVTFVRSVIEVSSGNGSGYFDSMTGIVFFLLVGRVLQEKTFQQLSFERDFTAYFPLAITVLKNNTELPVALPEIKAGDTLLIHNEELIPADCLLTRGRAFIDYSFVTGESIPVQKEIGEMVYAGGKQTGSNIELLVIREVVQSYLTHLWNRDEFKQVHPEKERSFVQNLSRYFTYIVFAISIITATCWLFLDPSKMWNALTAVLIVACPCALMLSNSYTNGNVIRILARNKFFLKNAGTIEAIAETEHIVFDKTGTLTSVKNQQISFEGKELSLENKQAIQSLTAQSSHPLCKILATQLPRNGMTIIESFWEETGKGIEGVLNGGLFSVGSKEFATGQLYAKTEEEYTKVYVARENKLLGCYSFSNTYREELPGILAELKTTHRFSVISGDNSSEQRNLRKLFGDDTEILFNQQPADKLEFIKRLQDKGRKIMMMGDGLNDAGALRQSNAGVAIADDSNNFTPASDAILEASHLKQLPAFIKLCKANKRIVIASFILSIVYNIAGISFAVQGNLSPLIAAVLMPASSISILLLTFGSTQLVARNLGL